MRCKTCNSELKDNSRFCTKCGSPVQDASAPQVEQNHQPAFSNLPNPQAPATDLNYSPTGEASTGFDQNQMSSQPDAQNWEAAGGDHTFYASNSGHQHEQAIHQNPSPYRQEPPQFAQNAAMPPHNEKNKQKKSNTKILALALVAVLLLLAGTITAIVFVQKRNQRIEMVKLEQTALEAANTDADKYLAEINDYFTGKDASFIKGDMDEANLYTLKGKLDTLKTTALPEYENEIDFDFDGHKTTVDDAQRKIDEYFQKSELIESVNYLFEEDVIDEDAIDDTIAIYEYAETSDIDEAQKLFDALKETDTDFSNTISSFLADAKKQIEDRDAAVKLVEDIYYDADAMAKVTRKEYDDLTKSVALLKEGEVKEGLREMLSEILEQAEKNGGSSSEADPQAARSGDNGLIDTYLEIAKKTFNLDEINESAKDMMKLDIYTRDQKTLVYECKFTIDLGISSSSSAIKTQLEESMKSQESVYKTLIKEMIAYGIKDPVVVIEYIDISGELIVAFTYKDDSAAA